MGSKQGEEIVLFCERIYRAGNFRADNHRQNGFPPRLPFRPMRTITTILAFVSLAQGGELHEAARACKVDRIRPLLMRHPALNEPDEDGSTPLHIAIDARQVVCVGLLLEAGADRAVRDRKGRTAYDAAEKIADLQDRATIRAFLASRLSQKVNPSAPGPRPGSLEYWVMRGQGDVVKMMLSLGADPNATGSGGTTPLADAALKGDIEVVRLLLARGARLHAVSKSGTQPIHDAALGGNGEVIRELVKQGADVNARSRDEYQTPLHSAAAMGKMKAVEALVAVGADLTSRDAKGKTPVEAAEGVGLTEVVGLLRRSAAAK